MSKEPILSALYSFSDESLPLILPFDAKTSFFQDTSVFSYDMPA